MSTRPVHVFYSYSHLDEAMMRSVRTHLVMLRRRGLITEWFDRDIEAGQEWHDEIRQALEAADLVLLFVSADFLNSDFCYDEEMTRALERAADGASRVIAVLLRPVDGWEASPFAHLQVTPRDGLPVSSWQNQDEALADVASRIRRVVERIREEREATAVDLADDARDGPAEGLCRRVEAELDELVAADEDRFLIVDSGSYYAQFLREDSGIWCEVVSNEFLDSSSQLDDAQVSRLVELGWRPPEENLQNWWWPAPAELSTRDVATFAVDTLVAVYGVDPSADVGISSSTA